MLLQVQLEYIQILMLLANDGFVNLTKMTWAMPNVTPSLVRQNDLKAIMLQPDFTLPISFLNKKSDMVTLPQSTTFTWNLTVTGTDDRPRYYIVGFQLARGNNQTTNSATFDCPHGCCCCLYSKCLRCICFT